MNDDTRKLINEIYQRTHSHCYDGAAAGNFLREVTQTLAARATPAQPEQPSLREAIEAMDRAKKLPIWDNDVPHKLHVELDIIFKALCAQPSPSSVGAAIAEPAPEKVEWSYSTNEENYYGTEESRRDIIALALEEIGETEGTFWIGKNKRHFGRGTYVAASVIEGLQEQAYEECGEFAETYLDDVTKEEEAELADFITNWAARVDRSNFWTVYDTEQIDIAEVLAAPSIAQDGQKSEGA